MLQVCLKDSNGEWELTALPDKYPPPAIYKPAYRPVQFTYSREEYENGLPKFPQIKSVAFRVTRDVFAVWENGMVKQFLPVYLANEPVFNPEKYERRTNHPSHHVPRACPAGSGSGD